MVEWSDSEQAFHELRISISRNARPVAPKSALHENILAQIKVAERQMLVDSEPDKFLLPRQSDMRYNWVVARLDALDHEEMTELVTDAWAMCVPKKVFNAYFSDTP